jgi:hypothetical protein
MTDKNIYAQACLTAGDIAALPSISLNAATEDLPSCVAIFFAIEADTNQILKIGSTANLAQSVQQQLQALTYLPVPNVRLAWLQVSDELLAAKLEQSFIHQFQPVMNGIEGKLKGVADLTISGWYDFQKINGELWGFYGNGVMPVPVPPAIAWEYKQELKENAKAIAKVEQVFGKKFTHSYMEHNLSELKARIEAIEAQQFVCPPGCYVSEYSVKRPCGIYYYYKLVAKEAIFPAKSKLNKGKMVKTLHLGRFNSLQEAHEAAGWSARKSINKMQRQIEILQQAQEEMEQERLQMEAHLNS